MKTSELSEQEGRLHVSCRDEMSVHRPSHRERDPSQPQSSSKSFYSPQVRVSLGKRLRSFSRMCEPLSET